MTDYVAKALLAKGIPAAAYHAGSVMSKLSFCSFWSACSFIYSVLLLRSK